MATWYLVFGAFFAFWGCLTFLRVVATSIRAQKFQLEAIKYRREEEARKEALLPIATATPITIDLPDVPE